MDWEGMSSSEVHRDRGKHFTSVLLRNKAADMSIVADVGDYNT